MKLKIWVMQGLQGSGKSTKAEEIVRTHGNTYRVNKDLLRQNLYCQDFNSKYEKVIAIFNDQMVESLLQMGHNVVSDNMNLAEKDINLYKRLAEKYNTDIEVVPMDVDVFECIARDEKRKAEGKRAVGKNIILNTAFLYNIYQSPNNCVVSDLDGTLCDLTHRRHLAGGPDKDWTEFFKRSVDDKPRMDIIETVLRHKANGLDFILVSACPEDYRQIREEWLAKYGVFPDRFIMRQIGDRRPDTMVKSQFIHKIMDKSKIKFWFDDRVSVIQMLKQEGINVIDVGDGTFI